MNSNWLHCAYTFCSDHAADFLVNVLAGLFLIGLSAFVAWVKPKWARAILRKINWRLSGDLWWLACDLHSIKLQAALGRIPEMKSAIEHARGHAENLGMKGDVLSMIDKMRDKYRNAAGLTQHELTKVREESDAIIDYVGKLAELGQPNYKP
jgi:hypothetical protein